MLIAKGRSDIRDAMRNIVPEGIIPHSEHEGGLHLADFIDQLPRVGKVAAIKKPLAAQ
jgi:hypothetical protein